jgi:hypothetical protein
MFIPDPGFEFFSIPDSRSASKNLSILTQKLFLSPRKYDPGCSSRILVLFFLPIPDPGVKKAPDPGSRIWIRNTVHKEGNLKSLLCYATYYLVQESTDGESESSWVAPADSLAALSPELLLYRAARAHNLPVMCEALALGATTEWHNSADGMRAPIHQVV